MNKKVLIPFLLIAVIASLVLYYYFSKEQAKESIKKSSEIISVEAEKKEKPLVESSGKVSYEKSTNLDEIENCDDLKANFPEAMKYIDMAIEDIFIGKGNYGKAGGYTTMSQPEFESLVNSGDSTALTIKGSRLVWEGIQGMPADELMRLYNADKEKYAEWYANFKIDFEKIAKGEEYQYQAGLRGKLGAIWESLLQKNVLVRQMIWRQMQSEEVYDQIIEKKALINIWQLLNKNNPEVLTLLNVKLMEEGLEEVLAEYSKEYDLTIDNEDFLARSGEEVNKFIAKWEKDRAYLGEDAYLQFIPTDFISQANKALELSCWRPNP